MRVALTVRKLKPGSYDDWRKAWEPDEMPTEIGKGYILRNVNDPDEIIAFGMFEGDLSAIMADPAMRETETARQARMAPFV